MVLPVVHLRQERKTDCGLACLRCAAQTLQGGQCPSLSSTSTDSLCSWSIQLVPLAAELGLEAQLCTTALGCTGRYGETTFYQEYGGSEARRRDIDRLFEVHHESVHLRDQPLALQALRDLIQQDDTVVIVLLDAVVLQCQKCGRSAPSEIDSIHYRGHFVVLVDIDLANGRVCYMDPASDQCHGPLCLTSAANFDRARSSPGTDDDIVVVRAKKPR